MGKDHGIDQVGVNRERNERARSGVAPYPCALVFDDKPGGRTARGGEGSRRSDDVDPHGASRTFTHRPSLPS
jgi:hypothetical protein